MSVTIRDINTCCFFGHREICEDERLKTQLCNTIKKLIIEENVDTFLFGSKSRFNTLCYELVTKIKDEYPSIKRVYVRAEYPIITDSYKAYLLSNYEYTYYPKKIIGATRAVYVKRNYEMIDNSRFCIVYFDEANSPKNRKSGTKSALEHAKKQKKIIHKFP